MEYIVYPFARANDLMAGAIFQSNKVRTTKYTGLSFFPKALYYIFSRISYIFVFLATIFVSLPNLAPLHPSTVIVPAVFMVGVILVKEYFEDLKRKRNDDAENSSVALKWENSE